MKPIIIALAKGRLADTAVNMLEKCGIFCPEIKKDTRKLLFFDQTKSFQFILVKASDVPVYVEYGAADIGIVGKDTIMEEGRNVFEMLDLGFGVCKMAVCGKPEFKDRMFQVSNLRVATKYPNIAKEFFHIKKGRTIETIKLNGSVELAPLTGLSEVIVDIVESGKTLHENGLEVLMDICYLSARVIVNRVSLKTETNRVMQVVDKLEAVRDE